MINKKMYRCDDGGLYYIREIDSDFYWFGEHPDGFFANVFVGKRFGNELSGNWFDVPKGRTRSRGEIKLIIEQKGSYIRKIFHTGGFFGTYWEEIPKNFESLPGTRITDFQNDNNEDLTGTWKGSDDGIYYIRQIDDNIIWFGERISFGERIPFFSNIFIGKRLGKKITGKWFDLPKGITNSNGDLNIMIEDESTLVKTEYTGGFGGDKWMRYMALTKIFCCNDGGLYYIREIGNNIYWFGEHPGGYFSNVFIGERLGNELKGQWFDVPKGRACSSGEIHLMIEKGGKSIRRVFEIGGFYGNYWEECQVNDESLPPIRITDFQGGSNEDLTGIWKCNDNAIYYIRQINNNIIWFGERISFGERRPFFSNIFIGKRSKNKITGKWIDLPKGSVMGFGFMSIKIENQSMLSQIECTGGFSGNIWNRY